jgi:hypothetical protein
MSRQPSAPGSPEQAKRNESVAVARAYLLDIEVGRPKRIDEYIDYFGDGGKGGSGPTEPGWTKVQ